jgi:hypothetical protein
MDRQKSGSRHQVHRLWREEWLQVRVHSPRKRAGVSSIPPVEADAPKVVWRDRFPVRLHDRRQGDQDRLDDRRTHPKVAASSGRALDHRRAACRRAQTVFAQPAARRRCCAWTTVRSWFPKRCNSSALARSGCPTFRPVPWKQRVHRIVQQSPSEGVPQPQPLDHAARSPGGDRGLQTRAQPPAPPLGAGLPHSGRVRCGMQAHPTPGDLRDQLNPEQQQPGSKTALKPGGLSIGDSPPAILVSSNPQHPRTLRVCCAPSSRPGGSSVFIGIDCLR